jgi:hypothetical protein
VTREIYVAEKQRLIRVQAAILKASREPHDPAKDNLIDALAQLTLTVGELLKEHQE